MPHLHLHLLSDSTGETLDNIAKAVLVQFDGLETVKHFWPMVRSKTHLDRVIADIVLNPGLVVYTIVNAEHRLRLETHCRANNLPMVAPLDQLTMALSDLSGEAAKARPGKQHSLDDDYFARVDAIHYTMAHDDGINAEDWEEADILLVGISRTSKTPTSIYLANRGYKTANMPLVFESPLPETLFALKHPFIVGLVTSVERLIQVRRNRLLSLNQNPETNYVDTEYVAQEVNRARRLFTDQNWPIIDVTRRSIEETAAAVISMVQEHKATT